VNTVPSTVFAPPYFHCNSQMGPISYNVTLDCIGKDARDKHSSLLWLFVSYKESEVL